MTEKKSTRIEIKKGSMEIDSKERLCDVAKKLYNSGSDNRSRKNGSPDKLIADIWASGHLIKTLGVYAILPRHLKTFLDTKKYPDEVDYKGKTYNDGIKEIATEIVKLYNEGSTHVYISINSIGESYLRSILVGEELKQDQYRKGFNLFGKTGTITLQEKSKIRGW